MENEFSHRPVLLAECIEGLAIKKNGIYVDGTAGGGGHSFAIGLRLTTGKLISIDQDEAAVEAAGRRLAPLGERARVVRGNFSQLGEILDREGIEKIDGILLDLGVSSYQLDTPERGFSYQADAPLDMRMDRRQEKSAFELRPRLSVREAKSRFGPPENWRRLSRVRFRFLHGRAVIIRPNAPFRPSGSRSIGNWM